MTINSKPQTEIPHIISLGAGVQSSTMALMAAHGEITPRPIAAVFSDTQAEPASVMRWLATLEVMINAAPFPFPIYRVTRGSLTDGSLKVHDRKRREGTRVQSIIPAFVKKSDGIGILGRSCTADYKVAVLMKKARELAKIKRGQKTVGVMQWIGISLDEAHRMKPSRDAWAACRWPLIEAGMKRHDCLRWMKAHGYPMPPRSACVYCPFHSDAEWRRLKNEEPEEFAKAVQFEKDLQAAHLHDDSRKGVPFLHSKTIPLGDIDFSSDIERGQGELFGNDCTGLCGV